MKPKQKGARDAAYEFSEIFGDTEIFLFMFNAYIYDLGF